MLQLEQMFYLERTQMHTLDPLTAMQLTAGSTLNRPSAVIRELIDNAIDAQASHISIYLDTQGELAVHDNGIGMTADELVCAFERHTTSKLLRYDDLLTLQTLGFRGEALAAIAAIARVTCTSRTAQCTTAHEVRIAGGVLHDLRPCAGVVGTAIHVAHLYHTMPHRRHFWRQPHTERQHIVDICTQYALIYPMIRFMVTYEQQTLLATPGTGDIVHTLQTVWPHITMRTINATIASGAGTLWGYIGDEMAPTRRQQIVAINQRPIAVRGIIAHLLDEVLPPAPGRHPTAVLHFQLPNDGIDINQRSHKDELGIRTPSVIARLLYAAIRQPVEPHTPPIQVTQQLPAVTLIGRYAEWILWSSTEGILIMDPANVMRICDITALESGIVCVPPYVLDHHTAQVFLRYADQWQQFGIQLTHNQHDQLCITRLPQMAQTDALDTALSACVRTIRRGGTFAMGLGHLLEPDWLYAQLTRHPNPWDGHALYVIGNQRIAQALRISPTTGALDQSPQSPK
jgi:DNA mismatch repair protein MutL